MALHPRSSSERWQCREAIHCDSLLVANGMQQPPSRILGHVLNFNIVAGTNSGNHAGHNAMHSGGKFVSGHVNVSGSCVVFDKYSFDNGAGGFFLGPIHVRPHADPLQRGVLYKPQGLSNGTPLYGVVVPAVGRRGCFRYDSAVVAPELAFFLDALPRGIEYVHANQSKLFFPDGRGDLYAAACLLMRDAHTLVHECMPENRRPPSHRPLRLSVPPVHFALLLACFSNSADVFVRFARVMGLRASSVQQEHLAMLRVPLQASGRTVQLTGQCITTFAAAQQAEAEARRNALARLQQMHAEPPRANCTTGSGSSGSGGCYTQGSCDAQAQQGETLEVSDEFYLGFGQCRPPHANGPANNDMDQRLLPDVLEHDTVNVSDNAQDRPAWCAPVYDVYDAESEGSDLDD